MSTAATVANVPLILKDLWLDQVEDYLYEDRPYWAMVDKSTDWSGEKLKITCKYSNGTSVAGKFSIAKANKRVNKYAQMEVETADLFALWSVDNKLITLTRDQKGSLVRYLDEATTDAMEKFRRRTAWQLWGNGGGAAARLASFSGADGTLANPHSVRCFEIDDVIEFSTDDGRGGAGVLAEVRTITAIDEDDGILTFDSSLATITGMSQTAYLFHEGDYSDDDHVLKGVPAYVCLEEPGTGSEPASLWGMNRTAFPTRLGGHRMTPTANLTVIEAIKEALTKAYRRSLDISHIWCSPEIFNEVEMSLDSSVRRTEQKVGKIGFEGLAFTSQTGKTVKLFADADIPLGPSGEELIFGLNMAKMKFHSAEEWPMWLTGDGQKKFMTEENTNAREGRLGGYGNHYTPRPGGHFVMKLAA
ncbi:MAG TPA: hypothetical protein VFN70_18200 [Burkholderiales bacterium]|nr:hypothetical protein [Burkholderiales bacterium]